MNLSAQITAHIDNQNTDELIELLETIVQENNIEESDVYDYLADLPEPLPTIYCADDELCKRFGLLSVSDYESDIKETLDETNGALTHGQVNEIYLASMLPNGIYDGAQFVRLDHDTFEKKLNTAIADTAAAQAANAEEQEKTLLRIAKEITELESQGLSVLELANHEAQHIAAFRRWFSDHPASFGEKPIFLSITNDDETYYAYGDASGLNQITGN